jgi:hypothetical protein
MRLPWVSRKRFDTLKARADYFLAVTEIFTKSQNLVHSSQMMMAEFRAGCAEALVQKERDEVHEDLRI